MSISLSVPSPEHLLHAPSGELKENEAGVILGYDIPHLKQVLFSE